MSHPEATHSHEQPKSPTDTNPPTNTAQISPQSAGIAIPERSQPVNHQQPHGCAGCDARWGGYNTSHCSGCHRTFTGLTAFDRHRDGDHANSTRHCVSPESVGLIEAGRAYPCWGFPGDPERQFAAAVGARITVEEA
ncbi:FDXHR family putative zinc-binding protein [Mycolicibacterium conceptionense]|uniref:FDXHR family putative zinc-binding protein n=1 Tax=Mycolicibacterium conceptionense TaxID=451644 RepID=UPI003F5C6C85